MEPALFCFDAYHVDTQHLACEGVVHDSWNDLLPIRRDLAIVDLPIVPVGDPDDDGGFPYPLGALQMLGKNDATLIAFDAPDAEAANRVHREAHGLVADDHGRRVAQEPAAQPLQQPGDRGFARATRTDNDHNLSTLDG